MNHKSVAFSNAPDKPRTLPTYGRDDDEEDCSSSSDSESDEDNDDDDDEDAVVPTLESESDDDFDDAVVPSTEEFCGFCAETFPCQETMLKHFDNCFRMNYK